jgi:hypothetical protein
MDRAALDEAARERILQDRTGYLDLREHIRQVLPDQLRGIAAEQRAAHRVDELDTTRAIDRDHAVGHRVERDLGATAREEQIEPGEAKARRRPQHVTRGERERGADRREPELAGEQQRRAGEQRQAEHQRFHQRPHAPVAAMRGHADADGCQREQCDRRAAQRRDRFAGMQRFVSARMEFDGSDRCRAEGRCSGEAAADAAGGDADEHHAIRQSRRECPIVQHVGIGDALHRLIAVQMQQHFVVAHPCCVARHRAGFAAQPGQGRVVLRPHQFIHALGECRPAPFADAGAQIEPAQQAVGVDLDIDVAECRCGLGEFRRRLRRQHAAAVGGSRRDRKHHAASACNRPGEQRVAPGVAAVGRIEQDGEGNCLRRRGVQPVEQLRMHTARPGPAADLLQTALVDRHHHRALRLRRRRKQRREQVVGQQVQPLQRREAAQRGAERDQARQQPVPPGGFRGVVGGPAHVLTGPAAAEAAAGAARATSRS